MKRAYEVITERIIDLLEQGTVPWHRPWGGAEYCPRSLVSGRHYRGLNVFMLSVANYESPFWLTFRQAKERGGHVRKGEKGWPCVYWNWVEKEDAESHEMRKHPFLKHYTVFNVDQCADIEFPVLEQSERKLSLIERCEAVVCDMPLPPRIEHGRVKASYHRVMDRVTLPKMERFESAEEYYCTLFHELVHSTGHKKRLNRFGPTKPQVYGSKDYAKEELVGEMGATFLCGQTGIENKVIDNSAAYISGWLEKIKSHVHLVIQAAGRAQKASDFIIGHNNGE